MENKKDKSVLLIALLILVGLTSGYVSSTYAKYTSTIEKNSSATIAKWSFDEENSDTNLIIDFASTYDPNTLVENRIAPGTAGSFSIALTNAETETGVDYTLSFGEAKGVPTNLKIYEDSTYSNEINIQSDTITGNLEPGDSTGVTVKFYWKWAYETANGDEADTANGSAGGSNGTKLVLPVTITGTQSALQ